MLQNIRDNAQGTLSKIIIGFIVVLMALWGVDSIVGGLRGEPEVAVVDGEPVTEREFQRSLQMERQRILQRMGADADPALLDEDTLRKSVLEDLVRRAVLKQDVARQGLALSEQDVDALIVGIPQFQADGQFSQELFLQTVRNLGMSVQEFRTYLAEDYLVSQLRNAVAQGVITTEAQAEALLALERQHRTFSMLLLNGEGVEVEVTEQDVEAHYEANKARYVLPERLDVAYLELAVDALIDPASVSDAEVREVFDRRASQLANREERDAAHILLEGEDGDALQARVAELRGKLDAGESFESLAATYSDDIATARQGGALGFAPRGTYDPAFDEALFGLAAVGDVSGPVRTEYGVHFIRLLGVRSGGDADLQALEAEVRTELLRAKAEQRFVELSTRLADVAYSAFDLEEPAQALGLTIQTREGVTREGAAAPFDHPALSRQLFSADVMEGGNNTEAVEIGADRVVVARVLKRHAQEQQALEAVKQGIIDELRATRLQAQLKRQAEDILEALKGGADKESLVPAGSMWTQHEQTRRSAFGLPPGVLTGVFAMPRPEEGRMSYASVPVGNQFAVVVLEAVGQAEAGEGEPDVKQVRQFLSGQLGNAEYLAYQKTLEALSEVQRF